MKHTRFNRKKQSNNAAFLPFFTSLVSVVLCALCLAGSSWAWFTADSTAGVSPIVAGAVQIASVTVDNVTLVTETPGVYTFPARAGVDYSFVVTKSGTANGYILVRTDDGHYFTYEPGTEFTLCMSKDSTVTISASWGTIPTPTDGVIRLSLDAPILPQYFTSGAKLGNGFAPIAEKTVEQSVGFPLFKQPPTLSVVPSMSAAETSSSDVAPEPEVAPEPMPEVAPEPPKCGCEYECRDGVVDANCEVCASGGECKGIPWVVSCSCASPCTDESVNTACSVCTMNGIAECAVKPPTVECVCTLRCSLDWGLNTACPVCGVDGYDACEYVAVESAIE